MPEQAILDLPLVEFEPFEGRLEAMAAHCTAVYGLAGMTPHADMAFHLAASLFRYRENESLFQLAALSAFFLRTHSAALAAERRVRALGTSSMREQAEAREELDQWQARSLQLAKLLLSVSSRHAGQSRRNRSAAEARVSRNLADIAKPAFQEELEGLLAPLMRNEFTHLDFEGAPADVFARLDREKAALTHSGNGHARPSSRLNAVADAAVNEASSSLRGLGALKAELEDLRGDLREAAEQLGKAARERKELEELLRESEQMASERALALEEARSALELSVTDARERLSRFEREQQNLVEQMRRQMAEVSQERDRLARELESARSANEHAGKEMTRVLQRATLTESEREDLLTRVASFDAERDVAAKTIEALKLKVAQSKEQLARRDEVVEDLQRNLEEMREELVASETRLASAQASVLALENESEQLRSEAQHTRQVGKTLTVSESRLTQTQAKLSDAELRISQLEAALSDSKERLNAAEGRIKEQRRNVEVVSGQLAEAETLSNERATKLARLETELAEARRNLGEASARLTETSGRLKSISSSGKDIERDLASAKAALEEQRKAAARLEDALRARDAEVAKFKQREQEQAQFKLHVEEQTSKLRQQLESQAKELSAKVGANEKDAESTREKLVTAELRLMDAQQKLAAIEEDLRAAQERHADAGGKQQAEIALLRERLAHAEAERETLTSNVARGDESQRGEREALAKQLAALEQQTREREKENEKARAEAEKVRRKLDETDAFLIARQRELERVMTKQKYLVSEIKTIADLRARMEQATNADSGNAIASEVARRLDNLFAEAGAPVHADRRTERIVVLHLKKSDEDIAKDQGQHFVATGDQAKEQAADEKKDDTRPVDSKGVKARRTSKKSKKGEGKENDV